MLRSIRNELIPLDQIPREFHKSIPLSFSEVCKLYDEMVKVGETRFWKDLNKAFKALPDIKYTWP